MISETTACGQLPPRKAGVQLGIGSPEKRHAWRPLGQACAPSDAAAGITASEGVAQGP